MADLSLDGIDALLAQLQKTSERAEQVENEAILAGAQVIQKRISERAPRSEESKDHLADNITISKIKVEEGGVKQVEIGPKKGRKEKFFYGSFLEYGTSKMAAKPFMGPGSEEAKPEAISVMKEKLREGIDS